MGKQKKDIVQKLNKKIEESKKSLDVKKKENEKKENLKENKNIKNNNSDNNSKKEQKIKNKTLKRVLEFTEAFIYIICIIVVIFANFYAPIYVQMIPLLFILGIVGKIVYDRPITTTVFGMLVAICAVYTTGVKNILQILLISGCMAIYIALGEVCGVVLKKSYLFFKKKSKRLTKKAIFFYFVLVITFSVSLVVYNYTNSNFFELNKVKQRLYSYFSENYTNKNFEIVDINYNYLGEKSFSFKVKEKSNERVYEFIVSKDEKFDIVDGYIKHEKANKEKNANEKLIRFFRENTLNEKYKDIEVGIKLNEVDNFELEIIKEEENITDENTLEFAKKVAFVLNDIKEFEYFKEFEQIIISLRSKENSNKNLTSYLYIERYLNNNFLDITKDYEYIKKALDVEYID